MAESFFLLTVSKSPANSLQGIMETKRWNGFVCSLARQYSKQLTSQSQLTTFYACVGKETPGHHHGGTPLLIDLILFIISIIIFFSFIFFIYAFTGGSSGRKWRHVPIKFGYRLCTPSTKKIKERYWGTWNFPPAKCLEPPHGAECLNPPLHASSNYCTAAFFYFKLFYCFQIFIQFIYKYIFTSFTFVFKDSDVEQEEHTEDESDTSDNTNDVPSVFLTASVDRGSADTQQEVEQTTGHSGQEFRKSQQW